MSRTSDLARSINSDLFGARGNGFRNRRFFTAAGAHTHQFSHHLQYDNRGLFPVKAVVIGGGGGGSDANDASGLNASGTGGGYAHKTFWAGIGTTASIVVGAAGVQSNLSPANRAGGTSSVAVDGIIIQATGGGNSVGGQGSGGDVNTKGGNRITTPSNTNSICGGSAGSPWGDGAPGTFTGTGMLWRMPKFWDIEDFVSGTLFEDFVGIGGGAHHSGAPGPTFGGGGKGGWTNSGPGGGGLVILYW